MAKGNTSPLKIDRHDPSQFPEIEKWKGDLFNKIRRGRGGGGGSE